MKIQSYTMATTNNPIPPVHSDRPRAVSPVCGLNVHRVTLSEVFEAIDDRIARGEPGFVVTPNVDHVCNYNRNHEFRRIYDQSFLVVADGTWVIWASHLLGCPIPEKISGSDLVFWLSEYAAKKGYSVFLFGAPNGVAERAGTVLKRLYPGIRIAGTYCPPMGFEKDPEETQRAIDAVKAAAPDICYVALGSPKQEFWMHDYIVPAGVPVSLGIGAGLNFITGDEKRAPRWVQQVGFEWLWRLVQNPRRLAKRYFIDDVLFFKLLGVDLMRSIRGRA